MLIEYLKSLPDDTIVSIGSKQSSGWFYFGRAAETVKEFENLNKQIENYYIKKYKYACQSIKNTKDFLYNPIRYNRMIKSKKNLIFAISSDVYISYWKRLLLYEKNVKIYRKRYENFETINNMKYKAFNKTIAVGQIGILIDGLYIPGPFWELSEWEDKYGAI